MQSMQIASSKEHEKMHKQQNMTTHHVHKQRTRDKNGQQIPCHEMVEIMQSGLNKVEW